MFKMHFNSNKKNYITHLQSRFYFYFYKLVCINKRFFLGLENLNFAFIYFFLNVIFPESSLCCLRKLNLPVYNFYF